MTRPSLDEVYALDPVHERMLDVALLADGKAGERWRALRSEIDLDTFWDGKALDFLPLVYRALVDEDVDDPDLPRLRGVHRRAWYANQLRFRWLAAALARLDAEGVDALVLKGVALAHLVYPDAGLRPMFDCDVLVRPGQVGRALSVLRAAGWHTEQTLGRSYARHFQEIDVLADGGRCIDLHWHITQWLVARDDEWTGEADFWARSVPLEVGGVCTRTLDPTDSLLHALVHGARHGWREAPQWVADAVLIVRGRPDVDWDRIASAARAHDIALPVRYGLRYLRDHYAVPVPDRVLTALDVPVPARARRMFARAGEGRDPTARETKLLGPVAGTYRFWVTESAPLDSRRAAARFPGWLADHWDLDGPGQIPAAIASRLVRRTRGGVSRPRDRG